VVLLVWNERLGKAHQRNERRWDEQLEQGATPQTSSFQRVILSQEGFELFSLPVLRRHHHRVLASKRVRGQMYGRSGMFQFEVRKQKHSARKWSQRGKKAGLNSKKKSTVQGEQKKV
jgi:hypothetical protein